MIQRTKMHHLNQIIRLNTFSKIQMIDSEKFGINWWKVNYHTKVKIWLFGQLWTSRIKGHQNIQNYQTCASRIKRIKKSQQKSKMKTFKHLEIFKCFVLKITLTSEVSFTKFQADSKKTFNMKVVGNEKLCNFVIKGLSPKSAQIKRYGHEKFCQHLEIVIKQFLFSFFSSQLHGHFSLRSKLI